MTYSSDAQELKKILDAIVKINGRPEIDHQDLRNFHSNPNRLWKLMAELGIDISDYQSEKGLRMYLQEFTKALPGQIRHVSKPAEFSTPLESTPVSQAGVSQT